MTNPIIVNESDYQDAQESNMGFCTFCKAFTTDSCEPDARRYKCDVCGYPTVYGAEEALLQGMITFGE